jgi:ATP-dependent Lon protease
MTDENETPAVEDVSMRLPILPLRNSVLFPQVVIPLAVAREKSIALIKQVAGTEQRIAIVTQRESEVEEPGEAELFRVGTSARILKVVKISNDNYSVIIQGQDRIRLRSVTSEDPYLVGEFEAIPEDEERDIEVEALFRNLKTTAKQVVKYIPEMPREAVQMIDSVDEPVQLCDFIAANMDITTEEKQQVLGKVDLKERLRLVVTYLTRQLEVSRVADKIQAQIKEEIDRNQKEYYLRQQFKAIKEQLGEMDGDAGELDELEAKLEEKELPDEVQKVVEKQLRRLQQMPSASSEYGVVRTYVETLLDLPWLDTTEDVLDIAHARAVLDADHYGLDKVKERLVEFLAVRRLRNDMKGPILCLIGPPGVGKTSLGKSVARALGREFVRIALGGVHDEAEIRGHRRTYVGALPGRIVQALRKAKTANPVIMLDEIDKVSRDFRGDPQSALLEVLDPEQNNTFSDHYIELPIDLSQVLFIANANEASTISAPLRDRMEMIEIPGYTPDDKAHIVRDFVLPKQLEAHGIADQEVVFEDSAVHHIIDRYTREAGVRTLERRIATVCRKVAVKVADGTFPEGGMTVDATSIPEYLGPERFERDSVERVTEPGITTGLAWTPAGGDILFIEATKSAGKGELKLTGQLGDVMKESALAALSYLKMRAAEFGLPPTFLQDTDVHIHFPAGATPKDGPSAGTAIFTTLLSLFTGIRVSEEVAMTGEITLRGNVLPVGGIKEKTLAAHRAGIKRVILPERNRKDMVDVPEQVKQELEFFFVKKVTEIPAVALVQPLAPMPLITGQGTVDNPSATA